MGCLFLIFGVLGAVASALLLKFFYDATRIHDEELD